MYFNSLTRHDIISERAVGHFLSIVPRKRKRYGVFSIGLHRNFCAGRVLYGSVGGYGVLGVGSRRLIAIDHVFNCPNVSLRSGY